MEIAQLDDIGAGEQESIIEEFYMMGMARQYLDQGGVDYARDVLEDSVGRDQASQILELVERSIRSTRGAVS